MELVGFYDPNDAIAREVVEKYGLKRYTNENELIEACDAIDVVTPTQFHFAVCEKAIKKKANTFLWRNPWRTPWKRQKTW